MQTHQQVTEWHGNRRQLFQKTKDAAITAGKVVFVISPVAVVLASCSDDSHILPGGTNWVKPPNRDNVPR